MKELTKCYIFAKQLIKNKSSSAVNRRPDIFFLLIQTPFLVNLLCYIGNNNQEDNNQSLQIS